MSNLRNKIAGFDKKAGSVVGADLIQLANTAHDEVNNAWSSVLAFQKQLEANEDELSDVDYDEYRTLQKDVESFMSQLNKMEIYLSSFAQDPGFEK